MRRKTQKSLILAAMGMCLAMLAIVPGVTHQPSPLVGYVGVLAICRVCLCIPVSLLFGRGATDVSIQPGMTKPWVPVGALALPVIVFFGAKTR